MSISGYQDRIGTTYWTSADVSWDGTKWSAGTVSEFTMTPQSAAHIAHGVEARFLLKLDTVALLELHNGAGGLVREWILPAVIGQYVAVRFDPSTFTAVRFVFDNPSAVEVHEIEIGYTGTF